MRYNAEIYYSDEFEEYIIEIGEYGYIGFKELEEELEKERRGIDSVFVGAGDKND